MAGGTKEIHFEDHIVQYLTTQENGGVNEYKQVEASEYDKQLCIIPGELIEFIKSSQQDKYNNLTGQLGAVVDTKIIERVTKSLKVNKTLATLREGVKMNGVTLDLAFFKPSNDKTPEHEIGFKQNRLAVIRQLAYLSLIHI